MNLEETLTIWLTGLTPRQRQKIKKEIIKTKYLENEDAVIAKENIRYILYLIDLFKIQG